MAVHKVYAAVVLSVSVAVHSKVKLAHECIHGACWQPNQTRRLLLGTLGPNGAIRDLPDRGLYFQAAQTDHMRWINAILLLVFSVSLPIAILVRRHCAL